MRMGGLGAPELILIVVALVLVFGAGKVGDLGGALGKSVREFKKATRDEAAAPVVPAESAPPATSASPVEPSRAPAVRDYRPHGPEYRSGG